MELTELIESKRLPRIEATLVETEDRAYQWLVECPYCGKQHSHNAGRDLSKCGWYLGHRVAPCHRRYYLTPGFMKRRGAPKIATDRTTGNRMFNAAFSKRKINN